MRRLDALVGVLALLALPTSLLAQDAEPSRRLMRGDVSGTIGWSSVNRSELGSYNDWHSQAIFGLGGGWYWTNHLVTRGEFAGTTEATIYAPVSIAVAPHHIVHVTARQKFATKRVALLQHYQFRRNEWVHPYAGGGVEAVWERTEREEDPAFIYDPVTRQNTLSRPRIDYPVRTDVRPRGVLNAGVKAYLSRKAFASTELRVSLGRGRTEDVQWRFGFGADF